MREALRRPISVLYYPSSKEIFRKIVKVRVLYGDARRRSADFGISRGRNLSSLEPFSPPKPREGESYVQTRSSMLVERLLAVHRRLNVLGAVRRRRIGLTIENRFLFVHSVRFSVPSSRSFFGRFFYAALSFDKNAFSFRRSLRVPRRNFRVENRFAFAVRSLLCLPCLSPSFPLLTLFPF